MLSGNGISQDQARTLAKAAVLELQRHFGGEEVYVSRPPEYDKAGVLRDFTGDNAQELMDKHGIPRESFYRLLRRKRGRASA